MALTSKIAPYDSQWPVQFFMEKERVAKSFGAELVEIYHVTRLFPILRQKLKSICWLKCRSIEIRLRVMFPCGSWATFGEKTLQKATISIVATLTGYEHIRCMFASVVIGR